MNAKGMVFFTTVLAMMFGLFGTPEKATAAPVVSGVAITGYTTATHVVMFMTTYDIVVSGTITLGDTDKFGGFNASFTDPGNNPQNPTVIYTAPAQGATTIWQATYLNTPSGGTWNANANVIVMPAKGGGFSFIYTPKYPFVVPKP